VADVSIAAINTTGSFSVSNLSCTQNSTTEVECSLQVDANAGTGDIQVTAADAAGNSITPSETGYTIDLTPPSTPTIAPDLQSGSDLGTSNTDNITSKLNPILDIVCSEIGSTITAYSDDPSANTVVGTTVCTGTGTQDITAILSSGSQNITYTETDIYGNQSFQSPAFSINIDSSITNPTTASISDDNGSS